MKRFILGSLSATMALAVGATAQAQTNIDEAVNTAAARANANTAAARSLDEGVLSRFEYRQNSLTRGVLSPDDVGPNNRAVPTDSVLWADRYDTGSYGARGNRMNSQGQTTYPGGSVVSPNSQGPNNRATPGQGTNSNQQPMMEMQNQDSNLPGVVAPNSQGPNNRATPGQGTNSNQQPMMEMQNQDSNLPGVVAPNSQGPNNRATPGQ